MSRWSPPTWPASAPATCPGPSSSTCWPGPVTTRAACPAAASASMTGMRGTLTGKILSEHLVSGRLEAGQEIALRIDQTLLQDATGTMACMEFEAPGVDRGRVDLAVQYVDHNMLGFDHRNADDHLFLQGCAARYGLHY